jgi:predicted RNase H-like HicB family nuclease
MRYYPAIIRKEKGTSFGVDFPDFPGCITAAADLAAALAQAEEALRFHADGMIDDGNPLPEPTPLEAVLESADAQGGAVCMVRLLPPKGRAVRVNVTIDEILLDEIDTAAAKGRTTRSAFLARAAREVLERGWDRRLAEETGADSGRAIDRIGSSIAKDEKRRARRKMPPDTSRLGRSESQR